MLMRGWVVTACLAVGAVSAAADREGAPDDDTSPIAAMVNGKPLHASEIEVGMATTLPGKQLGLESQPLLQAAMLSQLIDRRLVDDALRARGLGPKDSEVDAVLEKARAGAAKKKTTLEEFVAERHMTMQGFREQVVWQLTWEKFMRENLTDAALEAFFNSHRRDYDGTQLRASHILLRPTRATDAAGTEKLVAEANGLRDRIVQEQISFENAVRQYSAGPSRTRGGDLGFFPRHGIMAEVFAKAAFALETGQLSQPVVTQFGVHLIKVTEVKPGRASWKTLIEQLRAPAGQELFDQVAAEERPKAKIEFTGKVPHFRPGTNDLVLPGTNSTAGAKKSAG
jgi:parvulin-like peptidyl-prolyl isomerase